MTDDYETERTATRDQAASVLRDMADGVAAGVIRLGTADEDDAVIVDVPEDVTLEVEFETEDDDQSVEVEIEWPTAAVEAEPTNAHGDETEPATEPSETQGEQTEHDPDDAHTETTDESPSEAEPTDASTAESTTPDTTAPETETNEDAPIGAAAPQQTLARFELFRDRSDEWRWRLVHRNGNVIATSGEGYTRKHNAEKGLRSVAKNAPGADVTDDIDN